MAVPPRPDTFDSDIADAEREVARREQMLGEAKEKLAALRDLREASARYYRASGPAPEPRRGPPAVLDRAVIAFLRSHPDHSFTKEEVVKGLREMGVPLRAEDPVRAMQPKLGRLHNRGLVARPAKGRYQALPEEPAV